MPAMSAPVSDRRGVSGLSPLPLVETGELVMVPLLRSGFGWTAEDDKANPTQHALCFKIPSRPSDLRRLHPKIDPILRAGTLILKGSLKM
jgi:hypothetical protein